MFSRKRTTCRLCDSQEIELAINLPHSIIADKYSLSPNLPPTYYPLDIYQCTNCGHVQCLDILPLDILFSSDYTYSPSRSPLLVEHFTTYASILFKLLGKSPESVFDIGSNDGLFLQRIQQANPSCAILGIDPAKSAADYANSQGVPTINQFFGPKIALEISAEHGKFDIISANNVFAHNDDLAEFTQSVSSLLKNDGIFAFEISYLVDIVEKALIGTIFHEHLSHHSLLPLIKFLSKFGLHLFHIQRVDTQGGALLGFASKSSDVAQSESLISLLNHETSSNVASFEYMSLFRSNLANLAYEFNHHLNELTNNTYKVTTRRIVGYGAARSANLLVEFFQLRGRLNILVDGNAEKIGKYLYGSSVEIVSEADFVPQDGDIIIPLAWIHSEKIYQNLIQKYKGLSSDWLQFYPKVAHISFA